MAKSISDEELRLRKRARRRLVGAIALVTIIAVFLPMVLDHEPKLVSQDVSIQIPSSSSGAFTSKIVPVVPGGKPAPDAPAKPEVDSGSQLPSQVTPTARSDAPKIAAAPAAKPADVATVPAVVDTEAAPPRKAAPEKPQPASNPADKPKAVDKNKARAKGGAAYVVQVAAFNDTDKAKQIREQLAAAGVKVYTEVVPTTKGNVTRVRAGPFASREDAETARDKLKGLGLTGNVLPK
jgi:DedD protein